VEIHADASDSVFHLRIDDDGCGIPKEKTERPATLRALRQRAVALNADFRVDSLPNEGTRLELAVPLTRRHRRKSKPAEIITIQSE